MAYSGRGVAIQKIVNTYNNSKNKTDYKITVIGGDENLSLIQADIIDESSSRIYLLPYLYVQYLGDLGLLEALLVALDEVEPKTAAKGIALEKTGSSINLMKSYLVSIPVLNKSFENLLKTLLVEPNQD